MIRSSRPAALLVASLLAVSCREKAPEPVDTALAQDLAMAQRSGPAGPSVFNDAPIGAAPAASVARGAPTPRPGPPRASAPTPRPSPRRQQPPAPIARSPQPSPPQPVATAPTPAPTPSPAPAMGVIGSGAQVGMNTNSRVCTAGLLVGDKFTATVSSGTVGSNGAAIPAGATVILEVASIDRSDPIESSRLSFRVRAIDVNGQPQPVAGDVAVLASMDKVQSSSGNDRTKVIGGAVAGAVLGRIFGGSTKATVIGAAAGAAAGTVAARSSQNSEACLPQGSPLRLTITRDIVVRSAI